MSGGSMDYLYQQVEDAIFDENTPERVAFMRHLKLVARALHDIEWVDSCDYGKGQDTEAIMRCISQRDIVESAVDEARRVMAQLEDVIERASARDES